MIAITVNPNINRTNNGFMSGLGETGVAFIGVDIGVCWGSVIAELIKF